ncbi:MAG: ubiquitin-like domain-containing protein [Candidatus Wallbacteria bacterium]|nr:ubiquitin-like domain-containing protein [Candidatus Wallbacteria bacterium]
MFVPLTGNYRIRELLSSPLAVVMLLICVTGMFVIFCDLYSKKCNVTLLLPNYRISLRTSATDVREALSEAGITLEKDDIAIPDLPTRIQDGCVIQVIRKNIRIVRQSFSVPPLDPKIRKTSLLPSGHQVVLGEIRHGRKDIYFQETYFNDRLVTSRQIEEIMVEHPANQVILLGTGERNRLGDLSLSLKSGIISSNIVSATDDVASRNTMIFVPGFGYFLSGKNGNTAALPQIRAGSSSHDYRAHYIY